MRCDNNILNKTSDSVNNKQLSFLLQNSHINDLMVCHDVVDTVTEL